MTVQYLFFRLFEWIKRKWCRLMQHGPKLLCRAGDVLIFNCKRCGAGFVVYACSVPACENLGIGVAHAVGSSVKTRFCRRHLGI